MDTSIKIGSLALKNPVTVASGTAGYGEELSSFYDISRLGALFTKGLSINPRVGNSGNRIIETPSGMLNSIGLENVGIKVFIEKKLPFLKKAGATVIANVADHTEDENIELCRILSSAHGIDALELNVSCPNVKQGGIAFGTDLAIFTRLLEKTRASTSLPLIVKLSPNVTNIADFALRAEETGADAVSAVNTFLGMKIDIKNRRPHFANKFAGLSGPAIRPLAVRCVYQMFEKISIPIIGMGGIYTLDDALEFIMAGASAVSIGTANLTDPMTAVNIVESLEKFMLEEKIDNINTLTGCANNRLSVKS